MTSHLRWQNTCVWILCVWPLDGNTRYWFRIHSYMYVCVTIIHTYMYVCIYHHTHIHTYIYVCICMYITTKQKNDKQHLHELTPRLDGNTHTHMLATKLCTHTQLEHDLCAYMYMYIYTHIIFVSQGEYYICTHILKNRFTCVRAMYKYSHSHNCFLPLRKPQFQILRQTEMDTETDWDRLRQTETDWDRLRQTETDWDRLRQTEKDWDRYCDIYIQLVYA